MYHASTHDLWFLQHVLCALMHPDGYDAVHDKGCMRPDKAVCQNTALFGLTHHFLALC